MSEIGNQDSTAATFGDDIDGSNINVEHQHIENQNIEFSSIEQSSKLLISNLKNSLPLDYDVELQNDPNFADFIKFHNVIKNFNTSNDKIETLQSIPKYDWEIMSFAFEYIYKLYTDEINDILLKFDNLDIKRSIWQESAFRMDGERASKRFKLIESWISDSDVYLNTMRKDLSSSVQIIKNTLDRLNTTNSISKSKERDADADADVNSDVNSDADTYSPTPNQQNNKEEL